MECRSGDVGEVESFGSDGTASLCRLPIQPVPRALASHDSDDSGECWNLHTQD